MKKPTGINVIAIYQIVSAGLTLLALPFLALILVFYDSIAMEPALPSLSHFVISGLISLIYAVLSLTAGISLLKCKLWAKNMIIGLSVFSIIYLAIDWILRPPGLNMFDLTIAITFAVVTLTINILKIWYLTQKKIQKLFS